MRTTGELIFHFRNHDGDEVIPRGGASIVASMDLVPNSAEIGGIIVVNIGVAYCSLSYNFCKKTGRELAQKRFDTREEPYFFHKILGPAKDFNVTRVGEDRFYLPGNNNPTYELLRRAVIDHFQNVVSDTLDYDASTGLEHYDFDEDDADMIVDGDNDD